MTHGKMTDAHKVMNPQYFGSKPADIRIRIWINPEILILILAEVRHLDGGLRSLSTV